jgi:hypothetical protein
LIGAWYFPLKLMKIVTAIEEVDEAISSFLMKKKS